MFTIKNRFIMYVLFFFFHCLLRRVGDLVEGDRGAGVREKMGGGEWEKGGREPGENE